MYGAGAQGSMDPMDNYNAGYAARLQAALSGGSPMADLSQSPDASQPSSLGPDTYRNTGFPQSAMAPQPQPQPQPAPAPTPAPGGAAAPPTAAAPPPQPGGAPPAGSSAMAPGAAPAAGQKSALDDSQGQPGQGGKQALSFRDAWQMQTKAAREKQLADFEAQLKKGDQTISSAYDQMMAKLGTRPQTDLSKSDKGMLLMEFGMNMMRNSASPASGGFGKNFGAAAGAAGATSLQQAQALKQQKLGLAHNWDVQQQQIGIAEGKEKANFAERSLLEEGRDTRANQVADTAMNRTTDQQVGAGQRNTDRINSQDTRSAAAIKQKNDEFFQAEAGRNNRAAAAQSGATARTNATIAGRSALASSGGARGSAMKGAYDLYMSVHGVDTTGQPLPEEQLADVRQDALAFAANPSKSGISDAQLLDLATRTANSPSNLETMGMTGEQRANYIQSTMARLRGMMQSSGSALAPRSPPSAAKGGATPATSALAPGVPRGTGGQQVPTTRPDGKVAPPQAIQTLSSDPSLAPAFLKRYGYLPPEFHKYLGPATAARASALQ